MCRSNVLIAVIVAAVACAAPLNTFGQANEADNTDEKVFAPFVSRIAASEKDGRVSLSWVDSRDAVGAVFVYRAVGAFDATAGSLPTDAQKIAEVPYGAQSYIDTPPKPGTWTYYLAAVDANGVRYDIVIPFGNIAAATVEKRAAVVPEVTPPPTAPAPGPETPPNVEIRRVTGVSATVTGDAVLVSFKAVPSVQTILVYRSAAAIIRTSDLLDAVIVQAAPASLTPVVDYPVPGIGYFYALVPEDDLKAGRVRLEAGVNTTTIPVEVPPGRYRVGLPGPPRDIRSMPLPIISFDDGVVHPANPVPLSPAAAKLVAELIGNRKITPQPERRPRAFPQDLETPAGGEEYALRSIVQGPFAKRDWEESAKQIVRYLSLSRTEAAEARARYYLGQAYFFSGRYSEALFEFLLAQSQYYAEGQEWIDAVLPRLISSAGS